MQSNDNSFVSVVSRASRRFCSLFPARVHGVREWWSLKRLSGDFWTFLGASVLFNFGMSIFFLLYNLYLLDRGFKEDFLGWVTSAMAFGSIAGTLPAGMLAQRLGLQRALLVCFTFVSLVSAFRALLISEVALLSFAFLAGIVLSIWAVSIPPAVAQLTSEQNRPFGFSLIFSFGIGVGALAGLVGGRLPVWLAQLDPRASAVRAKQEALLISCLMVVLAAWPAFRLKFALAPVRDTREGKFYPRNAFVFRFLLALAVWSLATGAFNPFFNVYFSNFLRISVDRIGLVFSGSQLSLVIAMLAAPAVFRRFGLITGIMYAQLATAVALACLAAGPGGPAAAVAYAGYTAFQWMSEPGMYSLLMNQVSPSERAGASSLNFLIIFSSNAIAAAAAGAAFVRFGYPAVLSVTAGAILVAALLFRLLLGNTLR